MLLECFSTFTFKLLCQNENPRLVFLPPSTTQDQALLLAHYWDFPSYTVFL